MRGFADLVAGRVLATGVDSCLDAPVLDAAPREFGPTIMGSEWTRGAVSHPVEWAAGR